MLSFFLNILATEVSLNLLVRSVHLSLSLIMSLIHSLHFFLSNVEEVFSTEESSIGILFGLIVVFCFFCGGRGIRIGDVEQGVL